MKQTTKRVLSLLCVVAMLLALVPSVFAEPTDSAEFAFYSTTDIHGKCWDKNVLNDTNENNNLLRVATVMKSERETYKNNVVLVDNGDLYQGTPVSTYQLNLLAKGESDWPAAMALCLSEIGYDMANVGNHEFNYGWDLMTKVRSYMTERGVASVCANLYYDGTDGVHAKDENAMTPYITKELTVGGRTIKIGLLGMVTPDCTRWDIPENYPGIRFSHSDNPERDMAKEAARYIPKMKAEGCDFIAVVFHSGLGEADGELTFSVNTENQVRRVIAKNEGIDIVVAGHDHYSGYSGNYYKDKNGKDVLVVNGGGRELTKTVFAVTKDSITVKSTENINLRSYASDTDLLEKIKPYADLASEYVSAVAGQAVGTWDSETNYYLKQSNTMDLIQTAQMFEGTKHLAEKYDTDEKKQALYEKTGLDHIDVDMSSTSVVVNGKYHVENGPITMKDIYRMYRYDNNLYLLALTGQQIKDILEQNASTRLEAVVTEEGVTFKTKGESFTNPVFGGLNFEYDMYQPEGSRAIIHGFANGRDFDLNKTYIVGVNNYHLGNAGCGFGKYSTADAIWSQTDDMGGGVVQDLIMEFFRDQADNEKKGVDPADFFTWKWELTYNVPSEQKPTYSDFTDLDPNGWYHDGVNYMIENGMMNGVGNGMFEPNGSVTRAMLVTILYRQASSPKVTGDNPFEDVAPGKYYTDAVVWAFQNGIVNGTTPTTFEPEEPVTREQIATILYRQAGSPAVTETDLSHFLDASDVSSYAANAVRWAVSEGVIKGSKIGTVADVYAAVIDELSPVHATGFEDIDGDGIKELFVQVKIDDIYYQMLFDICGDELKCVSMIQRTEDSAAFYSLSYMGVLYCTLLNYNEGFEIYRLDRSSDYSYQPTLVASYISYGADCTEKYQQTIASLGLYRENNINLYYNNTIPYELYQTELIALYPQDTATRAEISTMLMRYLTK